ncbi:response regulator [Cohnella hongkongensis]|uniref:Response regulator n=1 Tax=Cohnella hongkongensis TaxID=178337 RepID=A0ABV9F5M7_9BACL
MIRILIVDDEPYIVEGMVGLLEEAELPETEIRGAVSSGEALEWLARTKVDIVLSDIHMPGMNGLELQKRILQQWPRCKVVFLTGHNEFEYAKEALRYGASGYILKTDGDDAILDTIRRTIDDVREQSVRESYLESAQAQMRSALPLLQKEYLQELLRTPAASRSALAEQLTRLQIPLNAEEKVLLAQGRVLNWPEPMSSSDRMLMLYAIRNIAHEYWQPGAELISLGLEHERIVWLLQIRRSSAERSGESEADWQRLQRFAFGNLESIQATCRELLRLSVSFVMGAEETAWEKLPEQLESLNLTFRRSFGMGDDLLLRESAVLERESQPLRGLATSASLHQLTALLILFESGRQQAFQQALQDYMLNDELAKGPEAGKMAAYYQLLAMMMNELNDGHRLPLLSEKIDLTRLYQYEAYESWEARLDDLTKLADAIFEHHRTRLQRHTDDLVTKLKEYINTHISDDLSLTRLGEVASFNASYLSRIFKQYSGMNLTEYILQVRMNEATRLLRETSMQVQEITKAVGLESAAYFIRLFKKATHLTPQQYRELNQ